MIVYLHGLNSAGSSAKATRLREALPGIEILSPTYPAQTAALAVEVLEQELRETFMQPGQAGQPRVLVGSSMGGFYGAWLADRLGVQHLFMINPALEPWQLLQQVVGWQFNEALHTSYYLSAEMVEDTRAYATDPSSLRTPATLLLDKGDELIDSWTSAALYEGHATIHCFEGGSHAFDHMDEAVEIIGQTYQALIRESV
ncbi:MAG: YqiA/YcfP family alpha/beta fold hydrolase [Candidatus Thiodiazotropha sp.]